MCSQRMVLAHLRRAKRFQFLTGGSAPSSVASLRSPLRGSLRLAVSLRSAHHRLISAGPPARQSNENNPYISAIRACPLFWSGRSRLETGGSLGWIQILHPGDFEDVHFSSF